MSTFDATIPVIDLADFYQADTRPRFVNGLSKAFQEVGFVAVQNTGVADSVLDEAYAKAKAFFDRPSAEKLKVRVPEYGGERGYVPGEKAKGYSVKDFKEFLHVGRELCQDDLDRLQYYPNVWPAGESSTLKDPLTNLYESLQQHAQPIQEALEEALSLEQGHIRSMTAEGDSLLRAIHYPANCPEGTVWAAEHTDIDLFTILPKSTADGLQVKNTNGDWIPVRVPPGSFVINCGDLLENMTNGFFRSGPHRVIDSGKGEERMSMVLFFHSLKNSDHSPLPQCIERTGGVAKYATATRWDLLCERLCDLGLASEQMKKDLLASGFIERTMQLDRASLDTLATLKKEGLSTPAMNQYLSKQESPIA